LITQPGIPLQLGTISLFYKKDKDTNWQKATFATSSETYTTGSFNFNFLSGEEGYYYFRTIAVDNAGNEEYKPKNYYDCFVCYDKSQPQIKINYINNIPYEPGTSSFFSTSTPVAIDIDFIDNFSLATISYTISSGTETITTGTNTPFHWRGKLFLTQAVNTVTFTAFDKANNCYFCGYN
jgi:hypothetical protein